MLLFAYASNMNVNEFVKTVPSAHKIANARLPGYTFAFNKTAADDSSKANIVVSTKPDAHIWGVLIEYDDNEKGNFFNPAGWSSDFELLAVNCIDEDGEMYQAEAFTALPHAINEFMLPYDWYQAKIVAVARQQGLPDEYIATLSQLPHKTDPDDKRRARKTGN